MGKATRWLRGLFGGKKPDTDGTAPAKEKRSWGFAMPLREKAQQRWRGAQAATSAVVGTEERKGSYREAFAAAAEEDEEEKQSKRAIAVAAATAAVAEAAVAAAQAAAVVVRLTSSGRGPVRFSPVAARKREEAAVIKIQAAFRGYLARRALKALRGLVKLQALVRGNIVRKQAAETLRCMQALVRVQARARACRVLRSERCRFEKAPTCHVRSSSRQATSDSNIRDRVHSGGLNWLERWMEDRYWDSRVAVNAKRSGNGAPMDDEKNAKILEVDPGKPPQFHHKRRNNAHNHSSCSTLTSDPNSHSFLTAPDSPSISMESTAAQHLVPSHTSVEMQQSLCHLRFPFESAGYAESPQFYSASSRPGSSRRGAFTPSKSECSGSLLSGYSDYPNYMANTESSKAKLRSHSAPKQRPDRQNPTGPLAQRSSSLHAKFSHKAYPGSGRLDRLGMPIGT